jgi:DNA-binding PadR family transcriptional regulator
MARPGITGNHVKYYMLTEEGRKKLKMEARDWQTQSVAIARILEATSGEL